MSEFQLHRLRNLLSVILGGIECDRPDLAVQAVRQADELLQTVTINTPTLPESIAGGWIQ